MEGLSLRNIVDLEILWLVIKGRKLHLGPNWTEWSVQTESQVICMYPFHCTAPTTHTVKIGYGPFLLSSCLCQADITHFGQFRPFCHDFLLRFWCIFYRPKYCGGVTKLANITATYVPMEGFNIHFCPFCYLIAESLRCLFHNSFRNQVVHQILGDTKL